MYWLRTRTPGDMRSLLPCSKVTLLHRPRMPNTGAANALPECMGEDYVVPLGALVFQATRRLSDAQSARQTTSSRAKGRATGTWRSVTQDRGYAVLSDGNAQARSSSKSRCDTMRKAGRCWTAALLPASCVPHARTSKAVGSLRRHPSAGQHHWACVWPGRSARRAHPSRAMQGQRPPERAGGRGGCVRRCC